MKKINLNKFILYSACCYLALYATSSVAKELTNSLSNQEQDNFAVSNKDNNSTGKENKHPTSDVLANINSANYGSLTFNGQISLNTIYHQPKNIATILRFIPAIEYGYSLNNGANIDIEIAANLYTRYSNKASNYAKIKPYRAWIRYSKDNFEIRLGLQKINFGSAQLIRPLQWFDSVDPRDPLELTDGVWGVLSKYYFANNANIWGWALIGNKDIKGNEQLANYDRKSPEFGLRLQLPIKNGELAFSYHRRQKVDLLNSPLRHLTQFKLPKNLHENRYGFDIRTDAIIGIWFEAALSQLTQNIGQFTTQKAATLGLDYTFNIGNGPSIMLEHSIQAYGEKVNQWQNRQNITAFAVSYPLDLIHTVNWKTYYQAKDKIASHSISFQRTTDNWTSQLMLFHNTKNKRQAPGQGQGFGVNFTLIRNF